MLNAKRSKEGMTFDKKNKEAMTFATEIKEWANCQISLNCKE
jgi:hypothetical protein